MDSQVRLNPIRVLFHIKGDTAWRNLSTANMHPNPTWINPYIPMPENSTEEITARRLFERAANASSMKPWNDKGLRQLKIMAKSA